MSALSSLSGFQHLTHQVIEALHIGRHVLLRWPSYAPPTSDFRWLLTKRLAEEEIYLQRLYPPAAVTPFEWLLREFEIPEAFEVSRVNLLQHTEFGGRPYWVEMTRDSDIESWLQFAVQLATDNNNLPVFQRAPLIIAFPPSMTPPPQDAGIAVIDWDSHYDDLDALMLASTLLRSQYSGVTRALLANMAVQIALYDVPLLYSLIEQERDIQLGPELFLASEAERRGWGGITEPTEHEGMIAQFSGRKRLHSLIKVQQGTISRRIWRAQASVLLLELEEARQSYIELYDEELQIPFQTPFVMVEDKRDLEISHINYQANNFFKGRATRDLQRLDRLTSARHALSHLKHLPVEAVRSLLEES